jgi:hypothetical protein
MLIDRENDSDMRTFSAFPDVDWRNKQAISLTENRPEAERA